MVCRYGDEAGQFTEHTLYAAGNVGIAAYNFNNLGVKAVAKRAAKDTGKALVQEHSKASGTSASPHSQASGKSASPHNVAPTNQDMAPSTSRASPQQTRDSQVAFSKGAVASMKTNTKQ